jgi:signal transduction histidine kinase
MGTEEQTILIVDDDRGLLRLIEKALRREGFRTGAADSGKAALDWLAVHKADLMLLDLKLEDIEGRELIERIKQAERCPPFIVITGQGDERVAVDMMKRGAVDYLVKDVDFLEFVPSVVKRAFEQLENARRLRQLEKEILEISDRERQRIGQDLHDGLCQQLAGIELMSQVLEQKLAARSKADAARARDIARFVREAISQTRLLARGLAPSNLESEGLMSALQELALNTEKMFGISCRFECKEPVVICDLLVATHLYRIAQEAISNAIKHGRAKKVMIELAASAQRTTLDIRDDGVGFPKTPARGKGMGLRIMQYRAGVIHGSLTITPNQAGGATISCSLQEEPARRNGPPP